MQKKYIQAIADGELPFEWTDQDDGWEIIGHQVRRKTHTIRLSFLHSFHHT